MRTSSIKRKTTETDISLALNIDGKGVYNINSGCPFLDHMLELFSKHSRIDLALTCIGDTRVDYHHTTEDIGITLGLALKEALGDKKGIERYGDIILPMDEALIMCAVDLSGRSYLSCNLDIKANKVGDFDVELVKEFMRAFAFNSNITLHLNQLSGDNAHHIIEGCFKALARAVKKACAKDASLGDETPSTKGVL